MTRNSFFPPNVRRGGNREGKGKAPEASENSEKVEEGEPLRTKVPAKHIPPSLVQSEQSLGYSNTNSRKGKPRNDCHPPPLLGVGEGCEGNSFHANILCQDP